MTYSTNELRELGIGESVVAWRRWRRAMRLTQRDAARLAGLCFDTLCRIELGHNRPRESTLGKLEALRLQWEREGRPRCPERRGRKPGSGCPARAASA